MKLRCFTPAQNHLADAPPFQETGEVHLWYGDLDEVEVQSPIDTLDEADLARWSGLSEPSVKAEFLASRIFVRRRLSAYAGISPSDLHFGAKETGRPFLRNAQLSSVLDFNFSHSNGRVALGVCRAGKNGGQVGVDLERLRSPARSDSYTRMAKRFFSEGEQRWLAGLEEVEAMRGFLRLWTCRESIVKCTGDGVWKSFETFALAVSPDGKIEAPSGFSLAELAPEAGFLAAVAYRSMLN